MQFDCSTVKNMVQNFEPLLSGQLRWQTLDFRSPPPFPPGVIAPLAQAHTFPVIKLLQMYTLCVELEPM